MSQRLSALLLLLAGAVAGLPAPAAAATSWQWPLAPPHSVVHGFAPPAHDWLPGHRGVDLAARDGERVVAAGAGRVVVAGPVAGVAVVAVRHADGLETTYQPVTATVRVGTAVAAGQVIGRVAARGSHCAPAVCLHWGLLRGLRRGPRGAGGYLDPLSLVGAGRVRLLPLLHAAGGAGWLLPAASGASVGSSAVVVGWAVVVTRRRRRPLPPDVASLDRARRRRRPRWPDDECDHPRDRDDAGPRR